MWETWVRSLGWEDPLEKGKATPLQYSGLENPKESESFTSCRKADEMQTGDELCGFNLNFSRKIQIPAPRCL